MSTSTHRLTVTAQAYANVSNGNINCTLINGNAAVRLIIGGTEPELDTLDFVPLSGSAVISLIDLEAEDDVWVRAESDEAEIKVIRGPAKVTFAAT